ncbi:MAG TPA: transposase, partial [Dehalococcoidia bacterium]|nr:transposase [Dehalococcoidia bacterium]
NDSSPYAEPETDKTEPRLLRTARGHMLGYCLMPDHVHLVLGPSASSDIVTFVGQYKNLSQRAAWTRGVKGRFWQTRFWDHFVRAEEQVEQVVQYVLNNPVRKGLVDHWGAYPFSGSLVFPLRRESRGQAPALQVEIPAGGTGQAPALQTSLAPVRGENGVPV